MSNDYPNFAELKGELQDEKLPALREAGLIPKEKIRWFETYREHYEEGDGVHYEDGKPAQYYYNSETYVNRVRQAVSKTLSNAVKNGNHSVVEHAVGLTDADDNDSLPFQQYFRLEQLIHGDRFKIPVFSGGQGGGKSYMAYLIAKYKANLCKRDNQTFRVVTNSLTAVRKNEEIDTVIKSPQELWKYRLQEPGTVVFVFDEASSFLDSKAGGNASQLAKFVPFLRRLRKMDILPIMVTHRLKDLGTDVRNMDSVFIIEKPTEEKAIIYKSVPDYEDEDVYFTLSGFSTEDRYTYDTEDIFISWSWDGLEDVTELFSEPEQLRSIWETHGIVRDLKDVKEQLDKQEELKQKRKELAREAWELDEYDKQEIAEFSGVSVQTVSSWNLHKEI